MCSFRDLARSQSSHLLSCSFSSSSPVSLLFLSLFSLFPLFSFYPSIPLCSPIASFSGPPACPSLFIPFSQCSSAHPRTASPSFSAPPIVGCERSGQLEGDGLETENLGGLVFGWAYLFHPFVGPCSRPRARPDPKASPSAAPKDAG